MRTLDQIVSEIPVDIRNLVRTAVDKGRSNFARRYMQASQGFGPVMAGAVVERIAVEHQ
jgi:hypothetical protein